MGASEHTPIFNLKAVVQETGLKPDTLRAWERRYGLPQPNRTAGGHRLYSQYDIDMLKWFIERQQEGMSISRAVDLWQRLKAEGEDPLQVTPYAVLETAPSRSLPSGDTITELRQAWIRACLAFDEQQAERILTQAFAVYPAELVCFELLQKGLAAIGEGWYRGEITVQQEHFASALATRRIEAMLAAAPAPTRPGRILAACPPEERHTFSLHLLTLLLRRQGWEVLYLGANVPLARLEATMETAKPQLVILAAQQLQTAATLLEMAALLQRERVPMAFGGAIFNRLPDLPGRIPGHFLGEQLEQAPQTVEKLLSGPRLSPPARPKSPAYQQALEHYRDQQALIESQVWKHLKELADVHLAQANTSLAHNIVAALTLGDVEFLSSDLHWVEGLLLNYQTTAGALYDYMEVYYQAAQQYLDERGQPVLEWLAKVVADDRTIETN